MYFKSLLCFIKCYIDWKGNTVFVLSVISIIDNCETHKRALPDSQVMHNQGRNVMYTCIISSACQRDTLLQENMLCILFIT